MSMFLGVIFHSFFSFLVASYFKKPLLFFIIFFASVVLNITFLSMFSSINSLSILFIIFIECLLFFIFFKKNNSKFLIFNYKEIFEQFKKLFFEDKLFIFLSIGFLVFIFASFILAAFYPPTEGDAISYHGLRPLFWLSEGKIFNFDIADIRCHIMPMNSEIFYTWVLALTKKDIGFGLLQFFSFFFYIGSVYKIMEFLNIDFKKRIWAIFLVSSLPLLVCEISSLQSDLLVASLASFAIYMALEFKKEGKINSIYFSSLAFALMFGVKTTAFFVFTPIFVWLLFYLKKDIFKFLAFFILNFLIFSSSVYISNFISYGNFLGNFASFSENGFWGGIKGYFSNVIRHIFLFFDFSGFKFLYSIQDRIIRFENAFISFLGISPDLGVNIKRINYPVLLTEQISGFGILGFFVFIPCFIKGFFDKKLRLFSIFLFSFILILSFSIAYMMYNIRFLLTAVLIAAPLFSLSYNKIFKYIVAFIVFISFLYFPFNVNERKFYFDEFLKTKNLKAFQDNLRNKTYYFKNKISPEVQLKNNIEPYCKNSSKIGLIQAKGVEIYNTKYLEYENNCKIDVLTILHFDDVEPSYYDYFILPLDFMNSADTINLSDIKKEGKIKNAACIFANKEGRSYSFSTNNLKNADMALCKIRPQHFFENNFSYLKQFEIKLHDAGNLAKFIVLERK